MGDVQLRKPYLRIVAEVLLGIVAILFGLYFFEGGFNSLTAIISDGMALTMFALGCLYIFVAAMKFHLIRHGVNPEELVGPEIPEYGYRDKWERENL